MLNIKYNNVQFRGQFGEAFKLFQEGETITMRDFKNGSYEPTSKVSRFMFLLDQAGIKYTNVGDSLRTTVITKAD